MTDAHWADVYVGKRIRAMRHERGLTQPRLADLVGITFQQIQKYEKAANRVSCSMLIELCFAFACEPRDLLPAMNLHPQSALDKLPKRRALRRKPAPTEVDTYVGRRIQELQKEDVALNVARELFGNDR